MIFKGIRKKLQREAGVALMLTLSSILILSAVVVEFAYNTHVTYEMAANQRDRLKAYYLARSAMNFSRLELMLERRLRAQFASLLQNLPPGIGLTSDPLCKTFPFSTEMMKGVLSGGLTALMGGEDGGETPPPPPEESEEGEAVDDEGFFSFGGNFEVACDTEERKINLNVFRAGAVGVPVPPPEEGGRPQPGQALQSQLYEEQKGLLYALLSQKSYEDFFKGPDEIRKTVNAIADWADPDDRVNEAPGVTGSSEDSEYSEPGVDYKMKNGKYATVAELLLVPGIGDDLYALLAPQITVYGDQKINLCQAPDEIIRAFASKISPLADEDRLGQAVEAVRTACDNPNPQPAQVAGALTAIVGAPQGGPALASLITTTNRFYSIRSTGRVEESEVSLVTVLDTENPNPNLWKTLYFRVE